MHDVQQFDDDSFSSLRFAFGIVGVEFITKEVMQDVEAARAVYSDQYIELVQLYFANLSDTMLTLCAMWAMDNAMVIYLPMVKPAPEIQLINAPISCP